MTALVVCLRVMMYNGNGANQDLFATLGVTTTVPTTILRLSVDTVLPSRHTLTSGFLIISFCHD